MNKQNSRNTTYIISVIITTALVLWAVVSGSTFEAAANAAFSFLGGNFSWFYISYKFCPYCI